jgi:hypothetical protein
MIPRLSAAVNRTAGSFGGLVGTKVHIPGGYAELLSEWTTGGTPAALTGVVHC